MAAGKVTPTSRRMPLKSSKERRSPASNPQATQISQGKCVDSSKHIIAASRQSATSPALT
jgi:hypothetical protein